MTDPEDMEEEPLRFPEQPMASLSKATCRQRWLLRIRETIARLAVRLGLPGLVADTDINDPLTGQSIRIKREGLFTRLTIDGRDYYFRAFTGRLDGTGCGCVNQPGEACTRARL